MDREALKSAFLARHGLAEARREPLAGDASTRRYERLHRPGRASLIFMDQPPVESAPCPPGATPEERRAAGYNAMARLAAGRVDAFICAASWLHDQGLSTPQVVAHDAEAGLAVLEDLGDDLYASLIAGGADEAPLYAAAIDALAAIHAVEPPASLCAGTASWPLLTYDDLALATGGEMFLEWWPKFSGLAPFSAEAAAEWDALWAPIRARGEAGATVFCHRDYHAENLIWLPERRGAAQVGMLDFQDALRAHPAWDLSMLLHDGRRDVSPEREAAALARYFELRPEVDRRQFLADYHALGALNVSRILFIFARQVSGFGRPKYEAFMPRMWRYLDRCLADPELAPIKAWFDRNIPAEARR
ncbi:MAG: N-acetylmuramate/N-acetylglucosamine kinase AmgK [Phenylobacterium sp.]|uniref:N-acetylmuramate/N-acetylglucosamine kinase AmgK n=1 Tax=Phenylobacterium sp. TaxID=1871053 RepID=UPI00391A9582